MDALERGLVRGDVLQRGVAPLGLLIDQHRMALGERATLDILPREADREALLEQRAECELLSHGPVDALAGPDHLATALDEALHSLVRVEIAGDGGRAAAYLLQDIHRDAGVAAPLLLVYRAKSRPAAIEPIGFVRSIGVGLREFAFEMRTKARPHLVDLRRRHHAAIDEILGIDIERRRVRPDLLVHQRLGERRLIALVVA